MPDKKLSILLVEDEENLHEALKLNLELEGYEVSSAYDGPQALKAVQNEYFDLIILDVMLPEMDGIAVTETVRISNNEVPILILSARNSSADRVLGLKKGADDYLTKPFYMKELILRVHALLKRNQSAPRDHEIDNVVAGDIIINQGQKKVTRQNTEVVLTPREYQVLLRLVQAKGELVSKKSLVEEIWGSSFDANTNTIEVYINFLRKKIDKPFGKDSIKTKIGFGYYFDDK